MKKILIIATIIFSFGVISSNAQGVFSSAGESKDVEASSSTKGIFRSDDGRGDGGVDPGTDPNAPIGEGLLILSVFAGGYSFIRNRKLNKNNEA